MLKSNDDDSHPEESSLESRPKSAGDDVVKTASEKILGPQAKRSSSADPSWSFEPEISQSPSPSQKPGIKKPMPLARASDKKTMSLADAVAKKSPFDMIQADFPRTPSPIYASTSSPREERGVSFRVHGEGSTSKTDAVPQPVTSPRASSTYTAAMEDSSVSSAPQETANSDASGNANSVEETASLEPQNDPVLDPPLSTPTRYSPQRRREGREPSLSPRRPREPSLSPRRPLHAPRPQNAQQHAGMREISADVSGEPSDSDSGSVNASGAAAGVILPPSPRRLPILASMGASAGFDDASAASASASASASAGSPGNDSLLPSSSHAHDLRSVSCPVNPSRSLSRSPGDLSRASPTGVPLTPPSDDDPPALTRKSSSVLSGATTPTESGSLYLSMSPPRGVQSVSSHITASSPAGSTGVAGGSVAGHGAQGFVAGAGTMSQEAQVHPPSQPQACSPHVPQQHSQAHVAGGSAEYSHLGPTASQVSPQVQQTPPLSHVQLSLNALGLPGGAAMQSPQMAPTNPVAYSHEGLLSTTPGIGPSTPSPLLAQQSAASLAATLSATAGLQAVDPAATAAALSQQMGLGVIPQAGLTSPGMMGMLGWGGMSGFLNGLANAPAGGVQPNAAAAAAAAAVRYPPDVSQAIYAQHLYSQMLLNAMGVSRDPNTAAAAAAAAAAAVAAVPEGVVPQPGTPFAAAYAAARAAVSPGGPPPPTHTPSPAPPASGLSPPLTQSQPFQSPAHTPLSAHHHHQQQQQQQPHHQHHHQQQQQQHHHRHHHQQHHQQVSPNQAVSVQGAASPNPHLHAPVPQPQQPHLPGSMSVASVDQDGEKAVSHPATRNSLSEGVGSPSPSGSLTRMLKMSPRGNGATRRTRTSSSSLSDISSTREFRHRTSSSDTDFTLPSPRSPRVSGSGPSHVYTSAGLAHVSEDSVSPPQNPRTPESSLSETPKSDGNADERKGSARSSLLEALRTHRPQTAYTLADIEGQVLEFCADQHGSRFIQQKLESATVSERAVVFREVAPEMLRFATDVFGNYVIQKLFEYGTDEQRSSLAGCMKSHIVSLSTQMYGCRVIQKALEYLSVSVRVELASELKADVLTCIKDQNGNHVIQKALETVPPHHMQFVIDAFKGQVLTLSTHPYGCRVIQRVMEYSTHDQKEPLIEEVLRDTMELVKDQYGNYVVQHVLVHGGGRERERVLNLLVGLIASLSQHKFASNVIEKCLLHASPAQRAVLIAEIIGLDDPHEAARASNASDASLLSPTLQALMRDQYGNYVVQKALEVADEHQRRAVIQRVKYNAAQLRRFTYGRHIMARVEKVASLAPKLAALPSNSSCSPGPGDTFPDLPPISFRTDPGPAPSDTGGVRVNNYNPSQLVPPSVTSHRSPRSESVSSSGSMTPRGVAHLQ